MLFDSNNHEVKKVEKAIRPILANEEKYAKMTNDQLQAVTADLKRKIENGASLDAVLVPAFSAVREACRRVRGEFPYKEQIMGGYILHHGNLAELQTGEGKTLSATMPVYLNALAGKGVHVVTVNEYLARRDAEAMGQVYAFLGLTTGVVYAGQLLSDKQNAYQSDIAYGTNSEFGFDYLRDNMAKRKENRVQRGLNYALIDEADSVLIDDARTPLIISGSAAVKPNLYLQADRFAKSLKAGRDVEVDVRTKTVHLTETGMNNAERAFQIENLYSPEYGELLHCIYNALKVNFTMQRDVDYMVEPNTEEILIIDPNTGRTMQGRQWSNGVHQAVEAKEGVSIKPETKTVATITYQNFFRLYDKIAGMTGTARTEAEEFLDIYNMKVVSVPTHKPVQRIDYPDVIYGTKNAKYEGLLKEVKQRHAKGQPVLVGTISVETSELLSAMMDKCGIAHNTLNAKNNALEAEIIAQAGRRGAVTIATNMAGRGTDIKLGDGVAELGGLCVLGSERHESRRIDNQLRGRSGRQGDPGMSRFYISVQDDLVKRFGSERLEKTFASLGDEQVESKMISRAVENAQKRIEGLNYDARKQLLKYDNVLAAQRESMYQQRNYILEHDGIRVLLHKLFVKAVSSCVAVTEDGKKETVDTEQTRRNLSVLAAAGIEIPEGSVEDVINSVSETLWKQYCDKMEPIGAQAFAFEKDQVLSIIDMNWSAHIDAMDKLRTGIQLRGYASSDPLNDYTAEGYAMFNQMASNIARTALAYFMSIRLTPVMPDETEQQAAD